MMSNKILQDKNGNMSSKRVWGSILLSSGIFFSSILFYFSLFRGTSDPNTALGIINIFLISGGGLLGIGVFEKAINKK